MQPRSNKAASLPHVECAHEIRETPFLPLYVVRQAAFSLNIAGIFFRHAATHPDSMAIPTISRGRPCSWPAMRLV